jgi:replication initiation and membrane attachment protein
MSYPWKNIKPKDTIEIETNQVLTREDIHVLTKLYQPLIGLKAYTLYMIMFADTNFQGGTRHTRISEILTKLDVGIPDFYEARVHLEGIGLLRIYRSKTDQDHYKYLVHSPMSAAEFYNDSMLHTMLLEKIGKRLFNEQFESLIIKAQPKDDFEEVTRSFLDVYHFDFQNNEVLNHATLNTNPVGSRPKVSQSIENADTFDYDFFKAGLTQHFVNKESLTPEIKELIYTFHLIYGIDELTMQNLILESADVESGKVDKNKFTKYVETHYVNQQKPRQTASAELLKNENEPAAPQETTAPAAQTNFSAAEQAVINHAKETPPMDYLNSIKDQKSGFVSSNEEWVIKELVERSTLSTEVVNIILHYVLVIKKNVTLEKNYTMTIANDWAQSGVRTAEDAILKIKKIYQQPKQTNKGSYKKRSYNNYRKQGRKKETLPDWALDSGTKQEDSHVSSEESESLQERLDRLKKLREAREDD